MDRIMVYETIAKGSSPFRRAIYILLLIGEEMRLSSVKCGFDPHRMYHHILL